MQINHTNLSNKLLRNHSINQKNYSWFSVLSVGLCVFVSVCLFAPFSQWDKDREAFSQSLWMTLSTRNSVWRRRRSLCSCTSVLTNNLAENSSAECAWYKMPFSCPKKLGTTVDSSLLPAVYSMAFLCLTCLTQLLTTWATLWVWRYIVYC